VKPAQNYAKAWQFDDILLETYHFVPNLSVSSHVHDEYQIGLTLDAPGEYYYRGAAHPTPIGSLSVLHPGEVHAGRSLGVSETTIVTRKLYIPPTRMQQITADMTEHHCTHPPFISTPILTDRSLVRAFLNLHRTLAGATSQLEQESLLQSTLTCLIQNYAESRPEVRSDKTAPQAIRRVREYLHDRYAENVSLAQLAEISELSPFHLSRMFAREVGLPPHRYQTQVRIAQAKKFLIRGVSLEQVALETGFSHQSHFGKYFKQIVGITPGRYISSKNVIDSQNRNSG
jgi:AraC-like DNA-binding protein